VFPSLSKKPYDRKEESNAHDNIKAARNHFLVNPSHYSATPQPARTMEILLQTSQDLVVTSIVKYFCINPVKIFICVIL